MKVINKGVIFSLIFVICFLVLTSPISAIYISEVEINPSDGSNSSEWVEIYNNEGATLGLSGWYIEDSAGQSFAKIGEGIWLEDKGYLVIESQKKKALLNNDGDTVNLYNEQGKFVDGTPVIKDLVQSPETWQYCSGDWKFAKATKGEKNYCGSTKEEPVKKETVNLDGKKSNSNSNSNAEEGVDLNSQNNSETSTSTNNENSQFPSTVTSEAISLNPKDIKENENTSFLQDNWPIISLVTFCVFLGLLLGLRRLKYKNEFRN